jgi:hypothetical protein
MVKFWSRYALVYQCGIHNKAKYVPLHATEVLEGRGGIAPTHSRPWH